MTARRVLQRVVMPSGDNLDVIPLYVDTDMMRGAGAARDAGDDDRRNAVVGELSSAVRFGSGVAGPAGAGWDRQVAEVAPGRRVSFATYFNAFPAGYWRRWTTVEAVTLRLTVTGSATVVVYRSTARGHSHPVQTLSFDPADAAGEASAEVTLPLTQFVDGGWYWFDVAAGAAGARLVAADWVAETDRADSGTVSIGITTFDRPAYVVEVLRTLGESAEVLAVLDAVYLVDQGSRRASEHPEFADATKALGDRLRVIEQPNLGGSGGFSRAMDETVRAGGSDYVLLLDDDVVVEPESIPRAVTFADLARRPTIVGGHMFSLHDRSVLNAFAETVKPYRWWWGPAAPTRHDHDFGRAGLRHTPWLHRRVDADYNGWWMCLIPTAVVRELGLALPVFIKWDDAEYGLRAREAGYPTVSVPGVAVWHVPWHDKNDAVDWQAYYHARNRLLSALLHSPYERGGRVVAESAEIQIQHLLSMQYSTAVLRLAALEDLLAGPDHLHRTLAGTPARLRALRAGYSDARAEPDVERFPPVRRRKPPSRGREISSPTNKLGLVLQAGVGALRQLTPTGRDSAERPLVALPYQDASWWLLSTVDSAVVSAADGASAAWYRRDPKLFRSLVARSAAAHAALWRRWPQLAEAYRAAAPEFTSPEAWRRSFGGGAGPEDGGR